MRFYLLNSKLVDDEEEDEILDTLCENLSIVSASRYAIPRLPIPKSTEWISLVLPNISEDRFKMMLRMNRSTFYALLSKIQTNPCFNITENRQYPVAIQLAVTLFRLGASGDAASVRKIATLFGIGDGGTIDLFTKRVFAAILSLESEYLYWPNQNEKQQIIANTFDEMPHCIGYIDGSEIKLAERPCCDPDSYYSRKQNFSIKLQAVCDNRMKIRHILVGFPGSVHDSRVFTNSSLFLKPIEYFQGEEWLAGDSAYKLSTTIITPFRRNSAVLEIVKTSFNKIHSQYRVRIENCFGLLKERFGSLKELRLRLINTESSTYACKWITACCILHNFIIEYSGDEHDFDCILDPDENGNDENGRELSENVPENLAGELKRNAIYNLMIGS